MPVFLLLVTTGRSSNAFVVAHKSISTALTGITLPSLPAVRQLVKHSLLDGALYFSDVIVESILDTIVHVRYSAESADRCSVASTTSTKPTICESVCVCVLCTLKQNLCTFVKTSSLDLVVVPVSVPDYFVHYYVQGINRRWKLFLALHPLMNIE